jgi:hypothetical protein
MNLFKSGTLKWYQVGLLKLCVLAIGIAIGANWSQTFLPYTYELVGFGLILGLYLATVWYKKGN